MASPFRLDNKVAIITGSSRGIGRAIAECCASLGAKVVISSRKADACEEVAASIKKDGGDATVIPCNISRKNEVEALIAGTVKQYGGVDILVCNAAVNPYYGPLAGISDEAVRQDHGVEHQEQSVALQSGDPAHGVARRRLGDHHLVDRRHPRHGNSRRLRHLEGGGLRARAQPRLRVGPEERAGELRRAGPGEDRLRARRCGRTRRRSRSAMPRRRCAASACRTRSARSRRSWPGPGSSFITGQVIVADGGVTIA